MRLAPCVLLLVLSACGDDASPSSTCTTSGDCAAGTTCRDGRCVSAGDDAAATPDGATPDAVTPDGATPTGDACATTCGISCCGADEICLDAVRCARDLGACTTDDTCNDDSYCEPTARRCVPYGPAHERNEMCRVPLAPGIIRTRVQCEWTGPPEGDVYPSHVNASSLPLVVDFGISRAPDDPRHPSIVVVTGPRDGGSAIIRILDGTTCTQQATLDDPTVIQGSGLAAGDLDGDGRAEIVAPAESGGIAAWTYDDAMSAWRLLYRSESTEGASLSRALSLADLDDDGVTEIIDGSVVYAADGTLLTSSSGPGDVHCSAHYVTPGIPADVDLDSRLELVRGSGVWAWDPATMDLVLEPFSTGPGVSGASAVADFGDFPGTAGDAPGRPEIGVIRSGQAAVLSAGGDVVFGPHAFPGMGDGGNPTIADFDGDGWPEIATAGYSSYTVFDPDCDPATTAARPGGQCASMRTDGILWTQPIQENSCAIMGSTVFDFEADGAAEVVYADECYARIFDGRDGTVLWSRRRSSATWIEGPTVADVDGDFHAEMVLTSTDDYRPSCPGIDPLFPGLRCVEDADCPTAGSLCVESICRCASDADCGDPELACAPPLAGDAGNVCRSTFDYSHGVRVYGDITDRWAGSRAIWNQHAYSVTNVADDGTIPRGSTVARNWEDPGLNNFRQNVQGGAEGLAGSDITVAGVDFGRDCSAEMPVLELVARACSRGPLGIGAGVVVVFYESDPAAGGREICRATTTRALRGGECEEVSCDWTSPPIDTPVAVHVRADVEGTIGECFEGNNGATLDVRCPPPFM